MALEEANTPAGANDLPTEIVEEYISIADGQVGGHLR